MGHRWWVAAGLAGLACVLFAPALDCGFVQIDDPSYVTQNPLVRRGLQPGAVPAAFAAETGSLWLPLALLSHMADVSLWGLDPAGHHLTNVLLHAANAALLFLVLHGLTGFLWRSAAAALLFLAHPLRVESVVWIAERKDLLAGLFALLTVEAYRRWLQAPSARRHTVMCLAFATGLLAKPMLVTLPVLLLLLDWWPLGRGAVPLRRRIAEKLVLAALGALAAVGTVAVAGGSGGVVSLATLPIDARVANAIVSYARYLGSMVWPTGLAVYYPLGEPWPAWQVVAATVVVGGLGVGALCLRRGAPYLAMGYAWFLVALLPVIGLVQAGMQAMADRFTYLPGIGLAVALVWGMADVMRRLPRLRPLVVAGMVLVVLALGGTTRAQIGHWQSSRTLFDRTLAVTERNWFIHGLYGDALLAEGAVEPAARHYQLALALEPRVPNTHNRLGAIRRAAGDLDAAAWHFTEALRVDPDHPHAARNLEAALRARGLGAADAARAVEILRTGIRRASRDRVRPAGERYYASLMGDLMSRHGATVATCRGAADPEWPFDLLVTVAADGRVAEAAATPPTGVGTCLAQGISGDRFPVPPFAPFHARLTMRLGG